MASVQKNENLGFSNPKSFGGNQKYDFPIELDWRMKAPRNRRNQKNSINIIKLFVVQFLAKIMIILRSEP